MKVHKWIDKGSFQGGKAGPSSFLAYTSYECENCEAKIELFYNNNDTYSGAMKRNNVAQECEKAEEVIKTIVKDV